MQVKQIEVKRPFAYTGEQPKPLAGTVTLTSDLGTIEVVLSPDTLRAILVAIRVQVGKTASQMVRTVADGVVSGQNELVALSAPVERVEE